MPFKILQVPTITIIIIRHKNNLEYLLRQGEIVQGKHNKTTHGKLRRDKDEYLKNYTGHLRLYLIHAFLLFIVCVILCGNEDKKNSHAQDKKTKIAGTIIISVF